MAISVCSQGNTEAIWVLEQENPTAVVGGNVDNAQQRRVFTAAYYAIPGMLPVDSLGGCGIARLRLSNWVLYGLYANDDIRNSKYSIKRRYYYNDPASPALLGFRLQGLIRYLKFAQAPPNGELLILMIPLVMQ